MTKATTPNKNITQFLADWSKGDRGALEAMLPLVYSELRRIAANRLRHERPGHTLQPTALVHEAYLRLIDQERTDWKNRAQFFGIAAEMMRRILINHAVARQAAKRGGDAIKVSLSAAEIFGLGHRLGSIEEGKIADVIVADGDPLESTTKVKLVFIGGKAVSLDTRQQELYRKYANRQ